MPRIVVLDYGAGNLRSVIKALETVAGADDMVVMGNDPSAILAADKVVFPGQGAIAQCMRNLRARRLDRAIIECIANKPFLGLCLGLQSLLDCSEEDGGIDGLGIISGGVLRLADDVKKGRKAGHYKVPHMGWGQVYQRRPHPLWTGIEDGAYFYFAHSYFIRPAEQSNIVGETDYICRYVSAIARDNLFAVQFHPEKSQRAGLMLLKNFIDWDGTWIRS